MSDTATTLKLGMADVTRDPAAARTRILAQLAPQLVALLQRLPEQRALVQLRTAEREAPRAFEMREVTVTLDVLPLVEGSNTLADTYRMAMAEYQALAESFARQLSEEQQRFDRLLTLFERQRAIEEHSPAGARMEQRDIDTAMQEFLPTPPPTRRTEP